ncbi:MAG: CBS domain-containing protein [Nanoarchaeota archaeon]|nr:CBS domain-containing protein [Nanoarchaeota archaeon]MBU4241787.1 CBS domain-containing protein [Nanoarchaeota archaeon]MBU4352055.1 CBS domain-containing protein [Nanoarchaeota archaeon]MBU4456368.1 CBS domain-containing protein [Nanoarchaeota archaeon]MCG2720182.1 CBS domain-containing protein [Nanoarchaeota archaeon]
MKNIFSLKKTRKKESFFIDDIKQLTAKDAMIKPVFLYPEDDVDKILKKLKKEETNVCIVVTKEKKFIGEISDEDIISLFLHQVKYEPLVQMLNLGYKREFLYKKAKELINKHQFTVKINTPINKIIELIYKHGFNYIPVLDKNKKVIGVVTPSSLITLLEKY